MNMKEQFLNKYCKLVTDNGYVLYGTVTEADDDGFIFKTNTKISFFNWSAIRSIVEANQEGF